MQGKTTKANHKFEQNESRKASMDADREKEIPTPSTAYSRQIQDLTREARAHIEAHYDIRYNVLDGQAEIREVHDAVPRASAFRTVTPQVLNTLVLRLHEEGIPVWDRDVQRLLNSLEPSQYHPITDYLNRLPEWDGTDRLTALARRVSEDGLWIQVFGIWMRGMVRQWTRITKCGTPMDNDTNQLAPILISTEQGLHKSTFCRMLLPPELAMLYTDKFELGGRLNLEFPLCRHALINLDEFDRFSTAQMAKLKNLMQLGRLNVRRPHATHFEQMQRTASFIGTSNTAELLTDPTGSRRFFCQEVEHPIDCSTLLDHRQLYAQILHELSVGLPYYLDKTTEEAVQQHNRRYYRASALREAFLTLFGKATDDTSAEQTEWLTATDIYTRLHRSLGYAVLQTEVRAELADERIAENVQEMLLHIPRHVLVGHLKSQHVIFVADVLYGLKPCGEMLVWKLLVYDIQAVLPFRLCGNVHSRWGMLVFGDYKSIKKSCKSLSAASVFVSYCAAWEKKRGASSSLKKPNASR